MKNPYADLSACNTSRANTAPSGTMHPPPSKPPARPIITPRTSAFERMNFTPSTMSCHVWLAGGTLRGSPALRPRSRPEIKIAETTNVRPSTQIANDAWPGCSASSALKCASHDDTAASTANSTEPIGNVPKAANRPSEFADASCSGSFTMFGTLASFAGPHSKVSTSIENEMTTRPSKLDQNGKTASNPAPLRSQQTMPYMRSLRTY